MEELDDITTLLRRYLSGSLTESEHEQLEKWSAQHPANRNLLMSLSDEKSLFAGYTNYLEIYDEAVSNRLRRIEDTLMESITASSMKRSYLKTRLFRWLPYAAALLIGMATATWYFFDNQTNEELGIVGLQSADIPPGGNRATLTLAGGRTIILDEARKGIVIRSGEITYNDGNLLAGVESKDEMTLLELSTPKGGTYQVILPDGTRVWLNAASTLKYPSRFPGTQRLVELTGEAYFSVAKDAKKPFTVISAGQEVEVLGTEFNVSAYSDDPETKTTLVEGKVRLSLSGEQSGVTREKIHFVELVPGEQGIIKGENLSKTNVDTALYTSWKSGSFYFKRTPIEEIMREVARWYDIEVEYEGGVPSETLSGDIKRDVSLLGLLDILKQSTINVSLDGRVLTVHE